MQDRAAWAGDRSTESLEGALALERGHRTEQAPNPKTQQHVAWPGAQAACRGRGHTVLGTVPGRRPDSAPYPGPARPSLLFILPGTQRLQEQHVIDNKPSAGQGLAIGSACKSRGWRAGTALQNKSLCYPCR